MSFDRFKDFYSDLAFNPQLNNKGDFSDVTGTDSINQALFMIMNTTPGSRIMDPQFGCNVKSFLFEPFDQETTTKIKESLTRAFVNYEPRIRIINLAVNANFDLQKYEITILYQVPDTQQLGAFSVSLQKL